MRANAWWNALQSYSDRTRINKKPVGLGRQAESGTRYKHAPTLGWMLVVNGRKILRLVWQVGIAGIRHRHMSGSKFSGKPASNNSWCL